MKLQLTGMCMGVTSTIDRDRWKYKFEHFGGLPDVQIAGEVVVWTRGPTDFIPGRQYTFTIEDPSEAKPMPKEHVR